MNDAALRIVLSLVAQDLSGGAFASFSSGIMLLLGALAGAGAAFALFTLGLKTAIEAGAALQNAGTMASIAISDGAQHVNELESAIVNLANTSQYKIADVDMAFRVLGGLGFDTGQILGGLGEQAIILAQALGGPGAGISAADAAHLLGQSLYLFQGQGITAKQVADELTGAYYNNMMSVSQLTEFLGMAGGTASALGVSFGQLMTFGSMLTPMFGSASSAGASLSYMMRNLAHPATAAMAAEIQKLGLQIYDSKGNFVGLKNIMDQLFQDTKGMTQQQKMDVFGTLFNVRSGRAAMDMMNQTQAQFDATYNRINGRITQVGQAQRDSNAINNTVIGTWNRLTTTLNDFFAKAGVGIGTALLPLMNAFNNLLSVLQKNPGFEKWLGIFLVVGTVLSGLAVIVLSVAAAIAIGLGGALLVAAGTFAGIILVAGLVAAAFLFVSGHIKQLQQFLAPLSGLFQAFGAQLSNVGTIISSSFGPAFQQIGQIIQTQLMPALVPLEPALKVIGIILGVILVAAIVLFISVITGIISALARILVGVVLFGTGIVQIISGAFQLVISLVGGLLAILGDIIHGNWSKIGTDAQNMLSGMAKGVGTIFTGLGNMIQGAITATVGAVLALIGGFVGSFIAFFGRLVPGISKFPGQIVALFQGIPGQMANIGHQIISGLVNAILGGVGAVGGAMRSLAGNMVGSLMGALGIHSPSTVMMELGQHTATGFLQGVLGTNVAGPVAAHLSSFSTPGIAGAQGSFLSGQGQSQQFTVNMQVDSKTMAQGFFQVVNGQLRQNGYTRTNR
jgi:TP901 family phage tail tape measure protein